MHAVPPHEAEVNEAEGGLPAEQDTQQGHENARYAQPGSYVRGEGSGVAEAIPGCRSTPV